MPLTFTCANAPQATFPCWPIACRFLTLMPLNAMESMVSTLPHISPCFILEPFFADDVCCRCFAGDIQVLENTPSMTKIYLADTKCTGKDALYAHLFLVEHLNATNMHMCECSAGDISVLAHCKSLSEFSAFHCYAVTGRHFPPCPPMLHSRTILCRRCLLSMLCR